jgi:hypothetical protein
MPPTLDPAVGQIVSVANVQPLVYSDEITDPEHAFLSEELRNWVEFELFDVPSASSSSASSSVSLHCTAMLKKALKSPGPGRRSSLSTRRSGTGRSFLVFRDLVRRFSFRSVNSDSSYISMG